MTKIRDLTFDEVALLFSNSDVIIVDGSCIIFPPVDTDGEIVLAWNDDDFNIYEYVLTEDDEYWLEDYGIVKVRQKQNPNCLIRLEFWVELSLDQLLECLK